MAALPKIAGRGNENEDISRYACITSWMSVIIRKYFEKEKGSESNGEIFGVHNCPADVRGML